MSGNLDGIGLFDFHLKYLRQGGPPTDDSDPAHAAPSIFTAVQAQPGLKLTPGGGAVDVLIFESIEKPSAN